MATGAPSSEELRWRESVEAFHQTQAWRHVPPVGPPQPAPQSFAERHPYVWLVAIFPIFCIFVMPFLLVHDILFGGSPPWIDNRMNDPLWVLYRPHTGEIVSHPRGRGTDSDGSGMM